MPSLFLPLALLLHLAPPAGEERFDPPLRGAYLGLNVADSAEGLRVAGVVQGGPAQEGGVLRGDLLLRLNGGESLAGLEAARFAERVRALPPFAPLALEVLRREERLLLELTPDPLLVLDAHFIAERLRRNRLVSRLPGAAEELARLDLELRSAVRGARRLGEAQEALHEVLGRFGISHLALVPRWTYASLFESASGGAARYHLGLLLERRPAAAGERCFLRAVHPGGPAERAGLLAGDEVVAVNGIPVESSPRRVLAGFEASRRLYTLQVERGESVDIEYRRLPQGPVERAALRADLPLGSLQATRASVRLLESPGGRLGYIHLWDLLPARLGELFGELRSGELAPARGLIVDLRGRGGQVQVLLELVRELKSDGRRTVLLIDRESRSAKEVLAYRLKGEPGFTLVGERTAGAVRHGAYARLPSGARLMFPVHAPEWQIRLTAGDDLEGRGVEPDVAVESPLPYCAGRDPVLERGIELLAAELASSPWRMRF
jgi:C-terminal processing protease CtpA/Prc